MGQKTLQTPTPRRFLTKRPASSQLLPHSTPTPMRFQSTPRFGSTQSATRQMEDFEEVDDAGASSQSSQSSANNNKKRPRSEERDMALLNSIEVDSSCAEDSLTSREERRSSSSSSEHDMDEDDGDERRSRGDGYASDGNEVVEENGVTTDNVHAELIHGHGEEDTPKPVKRRRLSSASTSPTEQHMVVAAAYDSDTGGHHHEQDDDWAQDDDDDDDDDEDDVQDKTRRTRVSAQQQQPTFQPAPRFKPAPEDEPFASGGQACTAAIAPCSPPPRRGAKYLVNGLASQLQGLLSKVKGVVETRDDDDDDGGGGPAGEFVARVLVEEVRLGARMHLVRGRVLSRGSAAATAAAESDEVVARCYMLAGGGGVGGGAGARMVKQGSVLRVMPAPAWNVHLGEEEWTVACDWSVESMES